MIADEPNDDRPRRSRAGPTRRLALAVAAVGGLVALLWLSGALAEDRAEERLLAASTRSAELFDSLLAREIALHRAVPQVLAGDPAVNALLADRRPDFALDKRLAGLAGQMHAAAIYVISADGVARAASNAGSPASFVGTDYRFRRYFREAMADGAAAEFALGSVTRRPGLYLASRVGPGSAPTGVVVVKVELLSLEADWARSGVRIGVSDGAGRILVTSIPQWRFRTLAEAGLAPPAAGWRVVERPAAAIEGWRLHLAAPASAELAAARRQAQLLMAAALALLGTMLLLLVRRARARRERAERLADAQAALEERVRARTAELTDANARLLGEIEERRRAEEKAALLNRELEQASRLATLGQIAAGVTHEISQPVAAIRASAYNAGVSLARGDAEGANADIAVINRLTDQIGAIAGELRSFSRKGSRAATRTLVDDAIDGALLLLASRLRPLGAVVERPSSTRLKVRADRVRLEQVLVNLIQNALDAQPSPTVPRIAIDVQAEGRGVAIRVTDWGEGVSAEMAEQLFTPFRTSRVDGLGLGLVISRDIATDLGGELDHVPRPPGEPGATFRLWLPSA